MVGHEVQDDFQSGIMSPFYKSLEFLHPPVRIIGKIWIYVVVVLYGIRGTGLTLDELGMRGHAALRSGLGRMPYDSRKPYMGTAQPPDVLKRRAVNVRKFPCAVVLGRLYTPEFVYDQHTKPLQSKLVAGLEPPHT